MKVRMAILSAVGEAHIEVPGATTMDECRERIRQGDCLIEEQVITQIKYNFDTIEEVQPCPQSS